MGRAEREQLGRTLGSHLNTIHETLHILDQTPPSSLQKVSWDEVVQMGDQVSKQATIGIISTFFFFNPISGIYFLNFHFLFPELTFGELGF